MGTLGSSLPLADDCGLSTMRPGESRVVVPKPVALSLPWLREYDRPVACAAIVAEVGRIVVLPEEGARGDELVRELIEGRRAPETDLASALRPRGVPEIVRRLTVTSATISRPQKAYRLRLSKTLFPLLDLDKDKKERRLYLYSVGEHLEVVSVAFVKRGFDNAPLVPPDL